MLGSCGQAIQPIRQTADCQPPHRSHTPSQHRSQASLLRIYVDGFPRTDKKNQQSIDSLNSNPHEGPRLHLPQRSRHASRLLASRLFTSRLLNSHPSILNTHFFITSSAQPLARVSIYVYIYYRRRRSHAPLSPVHRRGCRISLGMRIAVCSVSQRAAISLGGVTKEV